MAPRELKDAFEQQMDNIKHVWKDAEQKLKDNKALDDKKAQDQKTLPPPKEI